MEIHSIYAPSPAAIHAGSAPCISTPSTEDALGGAGLARYWAGAAERLGGHGGGHGWGRLALLQHGAVPSR